MGGKVCLKMEYNPHPLPCTAIRNGVYSVKVSHLASHWERDGIYTI